MAATVKLFVYSLWYHALLFHSCCSLNSCPHFRLPSGDSAHPPRLLSVRTLYLSLPLSALLSPCPPCPLFSLSRFPTLSSFPRSLFKNLPTFRCAHTQSAPILSARRLSVRLYTYHYIRDTYCAHPRQRNAFVSHTLAGVVWSQPHSPAQPLLSTCVAFRIHTEPVF